MTSRRYRRRSSATWSLRLRAVWSRPPASPIFSIRRHSMCMWMSSSAASQRRAPRAISSRISSSPWTILPASALDTMPHLPRHLGVGDATLDVIGGQPLVEMDGGGERLHLLVRCRAKAPPPGLLASHEPLSLVRLNYELHRKLFKPNDQICDRTEDSARIRRRELDAAQDFFTFNAERATSHHTAAVHHEGLAGDVPRLLRDQEDRRVADILGCLLPLQRHPGLHPPIEQLSAG